MIRHGGRASPPCDLISPTQTNMSSTPPLAPPLSLFLLLVSPLCFPSLKLCAGSRQARHICVRIIQQIAIGMHCSFSPRNLADCIARGRSDEQPQAKMVTFVIAAVAEAAASSNPSTTSSNVSGRVQYLLRKAPWFLFPVVSLEYVSYSIK